MAAEKKKRNYDEIEREQREQGDPALQNVQYGRMPDRTDVQNAAAPAVNGNQQAMPQNGAQKPQDAFLPSGDNFIGSGKNNAAAPQSAPVSAYSVIAEKVTDETVQTAWQTLEKYRQGKAQLERRVVDNEQWWKLRHWEQVGGHTSNKNLTSSSAWLWNGIANKHADAMDNYPEPNILPREEDDKVQAEILSEILPVILEQNHFQRTYSDVWWYKLKHGTGIYGIFWDKSKLNGLGDISIQKVDLLSLFWEPGITDIQRSHNVFHVELVDNADLEMQYPQLKGKLGTPSINIAKYRYDDSVDTTEKSAVVDWYYKKADESGRVLLHYCKFCNGTVLFATENQPDVFPNGWYDHGLYPFVFDVMYPVEGTPAGYGMVDIGRDPQVWIDLMGSSIIQNAIATATPRYFVRADGSINEEELVDMSRNLIHVQGNLGEDSIRQLNTTQLSSNYATFLNMKIEELKETIGNRDVSNGGTASGVTTASGIAALIETGGKLTRDTIKAGFDAYSDIITMCIELVRQFYDLPRAFRIIGNDGTMKFINYTNSGIVPQVQGMDFGVDMGYRLPVFDVDVSAQKQTAYSKLSQNELALQFYQLGFFNPQMADPALATLDMMDFKGKDGVIQKIQQNGTLFQQVQQLQQMVAQLAGAVDASTGSGMGAAAMQMAAQTGNVGAAAGSGSVKDIDLSGSVGNSQVAQAQQNAASAASPR